MCSLPSFTISAISPKSKRRKSEFECARRGQSPQPFSKSPPHPSMGPRHFLQKIRASPLPGANARSPRVYSVKILLWHCGGMSFLIYFGPNSSRTYENCKGDLRDGEWNNPGDSQEEMNALAAMSNKPPCQIERERPDDGYHWKQRNRGTAPGS